MGKGTRPPPHVTQNTNTRDGVAPQTLTDERQRHEIAAQRRALRLEKKLGLIGLGRHTHCYRRTGCTSCSDVMATSPEVP